MYMNDHSPESSDIPNYSRNNEQEPKGIHVIIESPDLIYSELCSKKNQKYTNTVLTEDSLSIPLDNVKTRIHLLSDSKNKSHEFSLEGNIALEGVNDLRYGSSSKNIRNNFAHLYQQYGEVEERGGNYFFTTKNGNSFLLSTNSFCEFILSTGLLRDDLGYKDRLVKHIDIPEFTEEHFNTVLEDYKDVLEHLLNQVYIQAGKKPPNQIIKISPTSFLSEKYVSLKGIPDSLPDNLQGKLSIEKPSVSFDDIGGQKIAKKEIQGLANALEHPRYYEKWGTKPPKGALLFGPPGTGKTLLVKALASETNAHFLHIQSSDITSKWYGDSEEIVNNIFNYAKNVGDNVILFLDEVDAIARKRDNSHEATQRIISTLLENMDGLESSSNIFIIASTNRLDKIDSAFLRSGRIDRWINVPLPEKDEREEIFKIHMNSANDRARRQLFNSVNTKQIAEASENHSGADIAEIIRRVLEEKVRKEIADIEQPPVSTEEILQEIKNYEKVKKEHNKAMGFAGIE